MVCVYGSFHRKKEADMRKLLDILLILAWLVLFALCTRLAGELGYTNGLPLF